MLQRAICFICCCASFKNADKMKLIKNEKTEKYHEIEVVKTFLFWSWTIKYRKVRGNVFRYVEPNEYIPTGIGEHIIVKDLFYAEV